MPVTSPPPAASVGTPAPRLRYVPGLDGLRAVAVTAVILYHAGFAWMPGGALGVDLFFVLSGFLITTLLLRELDETGRIALRDFYVRRLRRLFPALIVLLFGVAAYAAVTDPAGRAPGLRGDTVASLFYVANWRYIWANQSYFAHFGAPSPLLHVWSLAVEEQWYLLWPPALVVLWKLLRRSPGALAAALTALALASAWWMRHLAARLADPSRAYYGTDTRAHTLLVGAVLALLLHRRQVGAPAVRVLRGVGVVGLAACVWTFWRIDSDAPVLFDGGFLLFAVAAAAAIAGVFAGGGLPARVLSLRPFVALGRISYSLYLWHWLVDVWLAPPRVNWGQWELFAVRTVLAVAASTVSFVIIERPLRTTIWERFQRPQLATVLGAGLAALVAIGVIWPGAGRRPAALPTVRPNDLPAGVAALRVAVLGGSDGWALAQPSPSVPAVHLLNGGALGCGLVPGEIMVGARHVEEQGTPPCATQHQRWTTMLQDNPVDVVVIPYGPWEVFDHWVNGEVRAVGSQAYRTMIFSALDDIRTLVRAETNAPIVFLDAPCMDESKVTLGSGRANPRNNPERVAWVNDVLDVWAAQAGSGVSVLHWSSWLCPGGTFRRTLDGVAMRPDGVHLTGSSAVLAWDWLEPQLRRLAAPSDGKPAPEPGAKD